MINVRGDMRSTLLALLLASGTMSAQDSIPVNNRVSGILGRMENRQLPEREAALQDLCRLANNDQGQKQGLDCPAALSGFFRRHPDQAEGTTVALIKLLSTENGIFMDENTAPGTYNERDSEHYAGLIDIVASLNDDRSVPALAGAIATGGLAEQGLLKYGQKALEPLLDQFLNSSDPMIRSESLATAVTLLLRENDPASHGKISELIQAGLQDKEFLLRMAAIQAIERLDDGGFSFVSELRDLSEHDPVRIQGQGTDGGDDYPVRREAKRALQKITKQGQPHGTPATRH
jgi:HEAT repeat protein